MNTTTDAEQGDFIRESFKRWPRLYYALVVLVGPVLFVGLSSRAFLRKYQKAGTILNVGSGPRVLAADVINVDITKYEHVSIIAQAAKLPFEPASIARMVSDNVLEHVERPEEVLAEAARIMMSGGYLYISTPFLYPFHSSPHDYARWTDQGLRSLLERHGFAVVEEGVRAGPFSVVVLWLSYFFASLLCFGSRRAHLILINIFLVLFFPIKIFDALAAHLPFMQQCTSVLYIVGQRK